MEMKSRLQTIYQQKKQNKQRLLEVKNNCIAIVYKGVIENKPIKEIHRELYKATINEKKIDCSFIYNNSKTLLSKINKTLDRQKAIDTVYSLYRKKENQSTATAILFLFYFNRINGNSIVNNGITQALDDIESNSKLQAISDIQDNARDNSIVFYLASKHNDSASDHRDWQGKLYIDENWRQYVDKESIELVSDYIKQHNIKTLQWVLNAPVWLITRPNCRHYLKPIKTSEVLGATAEKLIKKYNMSREIGQRGGFQTLSHPRKGSWYAKRQNIEGIIARYEERLKMHQKMDSIYQTQELKNMIYKDKTLINKWKYYLNLKFS